MWNRLCFCFDKFWEWMNFEIEEAEGKDAERVYREVIKENSNVFSKLDLYEFRENLIKEINLCSSMSDYENDVYLNGMNDALDMYNEYFKL